jgi:hypothetical protein
MADFTKDDLKRIADDLDEATLEQLAKSAGGEAGVNGSGSKLWA